MLSGWMSVGCGRSGVATLGSGGVIGMRRGVDGTSCVCTERMGLDDGKTVNGRGAGVCMGTLGSFGGLSIIIVGCILGMVALGSNRKECGTTRDGGVLCINGVMLVMETVMVENMFEIF